MFEALELGMGIKTLVLLGELLILLGTAPASRSAQQVDGSRIRNDPDPQAAQSTDNTTQSGQTPSPSQSETQPANKRKHTKRGSLVIAPIPISSPAVGSGIEPVVGYIFPFSMKDKVSPPSVVGAAGIITNNGSRGFVLGGELYLKQDTYQITSGFAHGNINYDLYGVGTAAGNAGLKLPLNQTGEAFFGEVLRKLVWRFFLGPRFFTGHSIITIRPNEGSSVTPPSDVGIKTTLTAIGLRLNRDTRTNHFYPTSGTVFDFTSDFYSQALGSKKTFQSYKTTFNKYRALTDEQTLAYNAYFCGVGGAPPFYENCIYGTNNELRGYTAGRYLDRYMLATQLEYRLVLPKRLGLVAFGGIGEVAPGGGRLFRTNQFLPAGGGGVRFMLSKQYHVNLRADIGQGKDGHTFSMGIGEAF
jgi:Omp85 superfamily domain